MSTNTYWDFGGLVHTPIEIEITDTFGGQANYCWVRRFTIDPKKRTRKAIMHAAKSAAGWTGIPCRVEYYGDSFAVYPKGICQVMFLNPQAD